MNSQDLLNIRCMYRSQNSSTDNNDNMFKLLEEISANSTKQILKVGDFNLPKTDWKANN